MNDLQYMEKPRDMFLDGLCLFCLKKAEERWSSHGRCFDGHYCTCDGWKNFIKARQSLENSITPARENREKMLFVRTKEALLRQKQQIQNELSAMGE